MDRFFSTDMPSGQFLRNVLLFSLAGLLPVLAVYVLLSPGFAPALTQGGPALRRFLRQVLTNGVPVVVIVNYVGFFLFALSHQRTGPRRDPVLFIGVDIAVRLTLFFALHVVIYIMSADWFGSFGGNRSTALRVVAPTLARSALFENVSGVYLYATMVSAVPLYASAAKRSPVLRRAAGIFPGQTGPIVIAVLIFVAVAVFLTALASAVVRLQA